MRNDLWYKRLYKILWFYRNLIYFGIQVHQINNENIKCLHSLSEKLKKQLILLFFNIYDKSNQNN